MNFFLSFSVLELVCYEKNNYITLFMFVAFAQCLLYRC